MLDSSCLVLMVVTVSIGPTIAHQENFVFLFPLLLLLRMESLDLTFSVFGSDNVGLDEP